MKILVIGGSRFLGKAFVEEAQKKGHEITVFNRGNNNEVLRNVEVLIGDRNGNLEQLKNRKWDAVLDTSGLIPNSVRNLTSILKMQTDFYAFVSSISVYKDWIPKGIEEDYPVQTMPVEEADELTKDPNGDLLQYYGKFKTLSEQEAERNMPGKVLNIRAGQLVGGNDYTDRLPYWVNRISEGGQVLAPGNPQTSYIQLIDVKDLSEWILKMMEEKNAGTYNVTGKPMPLLDLFTNIREFTGSDAEFNWAGEQLLLENNVLPWTEMPLWIPEETPLGPNHQEPWKGAFHINIDKALQSGLTFRPIEETIREVHEWIQSLDRTNYDWKAGIDRDRENILLDALAAHELKNT
ncbi:NAD-dependent epimerase/dehydratase family protein [Mesobacillus boroniphilus]|uniref:UDP-glucose 4-epimerase n=1 Tax=Mesobacillus boroniphilus TaxID=308892 RepID=A0A944GVZ8_9BACI|nr:NAD-dependent epimerase/dehydratase family protein [Mesobacillus boroniphilus]MBS8264172.1 NAD-dependent epimerase/dehydratase family protein [Mesobacillus boroniphilus]